MNNKDAKLCEELKEFTKHQNTLENLRKIHEYKDCIDAIVEELQETNEYVELKIEQALQRINNNTKLHEQIQNIYDNSHSIDCNLREVISSEISSIASIFHQYRINPSDIYIQKLDFWLQSI